MVFEQRLTAAAAALLVSMTAISVSRAQSAGFEQRAAAPRQRPYVVDGLGIGEKVAFRSKIYAQYKCESSQVFEAKTWCVRKQAENGPNGPYNSSMTILHDAEGTAAYVSKFVEPAVFAPNEASAEIERLTRKFAARPNVKVLERRAGLPNAIIAVWGDVSLAPLDEAGVQLLAAGRSPRSGILIDYLGNFRRSAQAGLPSFASQGKARVTSGWRVSTKPGEEICDFPPLTIRL